MLFDETYFEEGNINQKPLIWSEDKIITKFEQEKIGEFGFGQVYENCTKIKKSVSFMKPISKRVISTSNILFRP